MLLHPQELPQCLPSTPGEGKEQLGKCPRGPDPAAGLPGRRNIPGDDGCFKKTPQENDALPQLPSLVLNYPASIAH